MKGRARGNFEKRNVAHFQLNEAENPEMRKELDAF